MLAGNMSSFGNSNDSFFGLFAQTGKRRRPRQQAIRRRICNLPQRHDHRTRKQFHRHLRGSTSERVGPNYHPARHHDHRQRQQPGGSSGPGNRCRPKWHRGGWQGDNGERGVDHYHAREPRSQFQSYQRPNRHSGAEPISDGFRANLRELHRPRHYDRGRAGHRHPCSCPQRRRPRHQQRRHHGNFVGADHDKRRRSARHRRRQRHYTQCDAWASAPGPGREHHGHASSGAITTQGAEAHGIWAASTTGTVQVNAINNVSTTGQFSTGINAISSGLPGTPGGNVAVNIAQGVSVMGGWQAGVTGVGSSTFFALPAAGVILSSTGGTATLTNDGSIGALSDRAVASSRTPATAQHHQQRHHHRLHAIHRRR